MGMLAEAEFVPLIRRAIPTRFGAHPPNQRQQQAILKPANEALQIVAGPGSGKTTVLVLRALKLVFVDGLLPENIVLTTFTRKAAQELRSRLIDWGLAVKHSLETAPPAATPAGLAAWLRTVDINRFPTGTLDGLCEDLLTTFRDPGDNPPVMVEEFIANSILLTRAIFPAGAHRHAQLAQYVAAITGNTTAINLPDVHGFCQMVVERFAQDQVNVSAFAGAPTFPLARQCVAQIASEYRDALEEQGYMDFSMLEAQFLDRLQAGRLQRFAMSLKALLVDEYQDTNPLQENIYFELVRRTGASFTVVGDDDQSLYRFRGATVELFCNFAPRFAAAVPAAQAVSREDLIENYRSTPEIVSFFNSFVAADPAFATGRVTPPKPAIVAQEPSIGVPVLGLFRPTPDALARDLSLFLETVFRGGGIALAGGAQVIRSPQGGDFGDCVFLGSTVNEYKQFATNDPEPRFPRLLRNELEARQIPVFNPRGQDLRDVPVVQELLGLMLECIDPPVAGSHPNGVVQDTLRDPAAPGMSAVAHKYMATWRTRARSMIAANPAPTDSGGLLRFVTTWQNRTGFTVTDWPILELCFKLLTWLPYLRNNPEGQVYLEGITRAIAQAAAVTSYHAKIIFTPWGGDPRPHDIFSVSEAIQKIFGTIAEGAIGIDEEIMPQVPRNYLPFMTIHQSKGLEFPAVIVDVSSEFKTNHARQRFRRFPDAPSQVHRLEDDLAPFCAVGPMRGVRPAIRRTFDDLVRLHYVAYSRPQSVLILAGLDPCLRYATKIQHVGLGWRADGTWSWRPPPLLNPAPAMLPTYPITLI